MSDILLQVQSRQKVASSPQQQQQSVYRKSSSLSGGGRRIGAGTGDLAPLLGASSSGRASSRSNSGVAAGSSAASTATTIATVLKALVAVVALIAVVSSIASAITFGTLWLRARQQLAHHRPSPTPSTTPTPTTTSTPTPTSTATASTTLSATATSSGTATPTASATALPTRTATTTQTSSGTGSASPSRTPSSSTSASNAPAVVIDTALHGQCALQTASGTYDAHTGCTYSTLALRDFFFDFEQYGELLTGGCFRWSLTQRWENFPTVLTYPTYIAQPSDVAADPALSVLQPLAQRGRLLLVDASITEEERTWLNASVHEIEFVVNTSLVNWAHSYWWSDRGYGWWPGPLNCIAAAVRSFGDAQFSLQPGFAALSISYLRQAIVALNGTHTYLARVLAATTPPRVMLGTDAREIGDDMLATIAADGAFDYFCANMVAPDNVTCLALSAQAHDAASNLSAFWTSAWTPACEQYRPDSAGSAYGIEGWREAYITKWRYHTGLHEDEMATVLALAQQRSDSAASDAVSYAAAVSFDSGGGGVSSLDAYFAQTRNHTNPLYWWCGSDVEARGVIGAMITQTYKTLQDSGELAARGSDMPEVVYSSSGGGDIGDASYYPGTFNTVDGEWLFNGAGVATYYGVNDTYACAPLFFPGVWEAFAPGTAVQSPLALQQRCKANSDLVAAFNTPGAWTWYAGRHVAEQGGMHSAEPAAAVQERANKYALLLGLVMDIEANTAGNGSVQSCHDALYRNNTGYYTVDGYAYDTCLAMFGQQAAWQATQFSGDNELWTMRLEADSAITASGGSFAAHVFHRFIMRNAHVSVRQLHVDFLPSLVAWMQQPASNASAYRYFEYLSDVVFGADDGVFALTYDPHGVCPSHSPIQYVTTASVQAQSIIANAISANQQGGGGGSTVSADSATSDSIATLRALARKQHMPVPMG